MKRYLYAHIKFERGEFFDTSTFGINFSGGYDFYVHLCLGKIWFGWRLDFQPNKYEGVSVRDYTAVLKVLEPEESPLVKLLSKKSTPSNNDWVNDDLMLMTLPEVRVHRMLCALELQMPGGWLTMTDIDLEKAAISLVEKGIAEQPPNNALYGNFRLVEKLRRKS